jgi:aminoglycoside phosphotransferase family enzyme
MEQQEIEKLAVSGIFPSKLDKPRLKETHISWVILTKRYAYKIKKPLKFSFLDFSTIEKRKYYCEKEVQLNKRLAGKMYLKAVPIFCNNETFSFKREDGKLIDYAVLMNRMDTGKEMDKLLKEGQVSRAAIKRLAKQIAAFHRGATVIKRKFDADGLKQKFNDLQSVLEFVYEHLGHALAGIIPKAIEKSSRFLDNHKTYLDERSLRCFIRDVHGDLHSGNIFLYREPVVFDCIEFNDSLRQIDILDEVAFLCMDLEAFHRHDLSKLFYESYLQYAGIKETRESRQLFNYYKGYRANVRAKVNALNALQATDDEQRLKNKNEVPKYLKLLKSYLLKI